LFSCIKKKLKKDKKVNTISIGVSGTIVTKSMENANNNFIHPSFDNQIIRSDSMENIKYNTQIDILNNTNIKKNSKIIYDLDIEEMDIDEKINPIKKNDDSILTLNKNKISQSKANDHITSNIPFKFNSFNGFENRKDSGLVIANSSKSKNTLIRMNFEKIDEIEEFNNDNNQDMNINNFKNKLSDKKDNEKNENLEMGEISNEYNMENHKNIDISIKMEEEYLKETLKYKKTNVDNSNNLFLINKDSTFIKSNTFNHNNIKNFFNENFMLNDNPDLDLKENLDTKENLLKNFDQKRIDYSKVEIGEVNYNENNIIIKTSTEDFFKSDDEEDDYDDNTIIDETIEIDSKNLKIIRSNLNILSAIGARLFWDFRLTSQPRVDIKITGTKSQISKIKMEINKIISTGFLM